MNAPFSALALISEEEYLAAEECATERHEYVDGMVFPVFHGMAGGARAHATVTGNVFASLHGALRGKSCRAYFENMKLRVNRGEEVRFFYPDVMVVCRPSESEVWEDAPSVLIEVLSEGTERMDMVEKRDAFFTIPSLSVYAMIDSRRREAVVWRRTDGEWKKETLDAGDAVIELPEIGCRLPLAAAYEGVLG